MWTPPLLAIAPHCATSPLEIPRLPATINPSCHAEANDPAPAPLKATLTPSNTGATRRSYSPLPTSCCAAPPAAKSCPGSPRRPRAAATPCTNPPDKWPAASSKSQSDRNCTAGFKKSSKKTTSEKTTQSNRRSASGGSQIRLRRTPSGRPHARCRPSQLLLRRTGDPPQADPLRLHLSRRQVADPALAGRRSASGRPASFRSSSALSVLSHGASMSSRPKCP